MERKAHWEKIYSDKSPLKVSWYESEPHISLEMIAQTDCPKDAEIIDVGGGTSVLVDHLLECGYKNLAVLDISGKALAYAKNRLGVRHTAVKWFESDVTEFQSPHLYDLWHDRAVFHFLTDAADRGKYIKTLKQFLREGGHVILATFAIGGSERCSGLDIVQYDSQKIAGELGADFTLIDERHEVHTTPAGKKQKFLFFHFVKGA